MSDDGLYKSCWEAAETKIKELEENHEKLKAAVTELLTKSPLLKGQPCDGSMTAGLVKKVLEVME